MWKCPKKYDAKVTNINDELMKLEGELDDKTAKITLAKFLRYNLGYACLLLTGVQLAPYQEITLKGMFLRKFSLCVWGRGCGKTFIAAIFCILYCIFNPGTKILIAGPTFRTARFIFNKIEEILTSPKAIMALQCFGVKSKKNDQHEWEINGGRITAIPLNGEKIRGFRANILVIDEYLLMSEEIIKNVLMPFLVAPQDMAERMQIRTLENQLIRDGLMKEEDRQVFEDNAKLIGLSSASYQFENLYETYKDWNLKMFDENKSVEEFGNYFISQIAWNGIPEHMINMKMIKEAQSSMSFAAFSREYGAQFTDEADSYFSPKKMHEATVPDGQTPTVILKGKPDKKYIISIDSNYSNSETADYFAMGVFELDEENQTSTLVHGYGQAGLDLKHHIKYFYYLMTSFNVEMVIFDYAGHHQFLDSANESELFKKAGIEIKLFDFTSELDGQEYVDELKKARNQYNREIKRIAFTQQFTSEFIRRANEHLQGSIDFKKIWFASRATANPRVFDSIINSRIDFELFKKKDKEYIFDGPLDLLEEQEVIISDTKIQCSRIKVSVTPNGRQTFDLPPNIKRDSSVNRTRKDNYTALLLGNWAVKCYFDIMKQPEEAPATFAPIMLR